MYSLCDNSLSCALKICTLFCIYITFTGLLKIQSGPCMQSGESTKTVNSRESSLALTLGPVPLWQQSTTATFSQGRSWDTVKDLGGKAEKGKLLAWRGRGREVWKLL